MRYTQDEIEQLINNGIAGNQRLIELERIESENKEKLFRNNDFADWLIGNIENYGRTLYVYSNEEDNPGNNLNEELQKKVRYFFQGVDFYAAMHEIQQFDDLSSCSTYYVLYKDFGFRVSCQYGETCEWTIQRVEPINPLDFIDLNNIINYYKQRNITRHRTSKNDD